MKLVLLVVLIAFIGSGAADFNTASVMNVSPDGTYISESAVPLPFMTATAPGTDTYMEWH